MRDRQLETTRLQSRVDAEVDEEPVDRSHLDDVEDGCGCTEIWEHLSTERDD